MSSLNLKDYDKYINMSNQRHLLVEGVDDERYFRDLFERIYGLDWDSSILLKIDRADRLSSDTGSSIGNREKVEAVCAGIRNKDYASRFLGFVDREFRGFDLESTLLEDKITSHKVQGRLVWSRGHSIENYLFEYHIFHTVFYDLSTDLNLKESVSYFKHVFDSILKLGCILSLIGHEFGYIERIESSISWRYLTFKNDKVEIEEIKWKLILKERFNGEEKVEEIFRLYSKWKAKVENSDLKILRWICHGHLGFLIFWESFARCVCDRGINTQKVLSASAEIRYNSCVRSWSRLIRLNSEDFPTEVFHMLNLPLPEPD